MLSNNITFILHKPQLSENIGACARGMKNFNFNKLIVIDPKPTFPNDKILATSVGAKNVINKSKVYDNLESALMDYKQCVNLNSANSNYHYQTAFLYYEIAKMDRTKQINALMDAVKHYHSATKSLNTKYYRKIARVFNTIRNEESSNNLSFIDALPPLNDSSTEGLLLTGSNNEKSLAVLASSNEIENNYFKSKINILKKEQTEISLVEYNNHYGRNIDFVNLTVPLDKKDEKPKSHLPKYIKEKWKLVLAMRSILGSN